MNEQQAKGEQSIDIDWQSYLSILYPNLASIFISKGKSVKVKDRSYLLLAC